MKMISLELKTVMGEYKMAIKKLLNKKKNKKNTETNKKYDLYIDKEYIEFQSDKIFTTFEDARDYFLKEGWKLGIDPCSIFSTKFYEINYPDIKSANINPLVHYVSSGFKEGRWPHFLFDHGYYTSKLTLNKSLNCLKHYLLSKNKSSTSPYFNEFFYKNNNRLGKEESGLDHFIKKGIPNKTHPLISELEIIKKVNSQSNIYMPYNFFKYEGNDFFDKSYYTNTYPGVDAHGLIKHFVRYGKNEDRCTANHVFASLAEKTIQYNNKEYDSAIEFLASQLFGYKHEEVTPELSVVIVNWNKSNMTLHCVMQLLINTSVPIEIIIVDNGSRDEEFRKLIPLRKINNLKITRLDVNRYFGEANNIGVEESKSDLICFLNNDAFVTKNWDKPLLEAVNEQGYKASSPKFLFPDGRLQEAGGQINSCGQNVQFGKGLDANDPQFNFPMEVEHASAACLIMHKQTFAELGGFDLRYEPAYYEDADLSAKLKSIIINHHQLCIMLKMQLQKILQ